MLILAALLSPRLVLRKLISKIRHWLDENKPEQNNPEVLSNLKNYVWLDTIAVDPKMRGRGLGKVLIQMCIKRSREVGRQGVRLSVKRKNHVAITFYENQGFIRTITRARTFSYAKEAVDERCSCGD